MTAPLPSSSDAPQVYVFTDEEHRGWEVRAIRDLLLPERRVRYLNPLYADGWLLFTCGAERRRYAPVPQGWDAPSLAQLREWCSMATRVPAPNTRRVTDRLESSESGSVSW